MVRVGMFFWSTGMTDVLGQEIKSRIEKYLAHPHLKAIASNPESLARIQTEFTRKANGLRLKLGDVYGDLETFHQMLFDATFKPDDRTRQALIAVLIYFLNPFDFFPGGIPLLALLDDRLVIACTAQVCAREIARFSASRNSQQK